MIALASETVQKVSPEPWPMLHLNDSGFVQVTADLGIKSYQQGWKKLF